MSDKTVNGQDYWNERFELDWVQNEGQKQSRFFGLVAVRLFPDWFVQDIRDRELSFCDWGCAMGDGTQVIHDALRLPHMTGLDFSVIAINDARSHYPAIEFSTDDLLAEGADRRFGVIFSSNTLEHFHEPWVAADTLSGLADDYFVMLVPFQESPEERHEEHFYSFEWNNLRRRLAAGHVLVYAQSLDVSELPDPQWGGKQILAIYASPAKAAILEESLIERGADWVSRFGDLHDRSVTVRSELDATIVQRNDLGFDLVAMKEKLHACETSKHDDVERLEQNVLGLQEGLASLGQAHAVLRTHEADARDQLARMESELNMALHRAADRDYLEAERLQLLDAVERMRTSRSWILTSPLRAMARLFR